MMKVQVYRSLFIIIKRFVDITVPIAIIYLSAMIYDVQWDDKYTIVGLLGGFTFAFANQVFGTYENWRTRSMSESITLVFKTWGTTLLIIMLAGFMFKRTEEFSRVVLTLWSLMTFITLSAARYISRQVLAYSFKIGLARKNVAIAGGGKIGKQLIRLFNKYPCFGYVITGIYDDNVALHGETVEGIPVKGTLDQACKDAQSGLFEELYLCLPLAAGKYMAELLERLSQTTTVVKYVPDLFAFELLHAKLIDMKGLPVISVYDSPMSYPLSRFIKRVEDIVIASLILLAIWPIMLVIAIGVRITSSGPIFYRQTRVGWNGKPFTIIKFRSMPIDTENNGVVWGNASKKTTTGFGDFIRSLSLDELPQFLNVLFGDMSIVGPRPERDIFIDRIKDEVPRYMQRHMMKSGITGWAQINGYRGDTCLKKRVEYDLYYIANWSLLFDINIILQSAIKGWKA